MKEMRDRLYHAIKTNIENTKINGHPEKRLPNTLSLSFKDLDANNIISQIKDKVAVSAGAACHSDTVEISHVLKALKVPTEWARGTIRFSTGRMTTAEEVDFTSEMVADAVQKLLDVKNIIG